MPKLSVVMASYNHERYIAETIQSVLDQTYRDFEFIITDDGSSDDTVKVIESFNDNRIRFFPFDKNRGVSIAMNNGIAHSEGGYISIINSDDVFLPDKLAKQVAFLNGNPDYGAVFALPEIIGENSGEYSDKTHPWFTLFNQPNRTAYEWLNYFFYKSNALCHPSVVIRKECYDKVGLYNPSFASLPDFDMWVRLCFKYEIFIIHEKLLKFRILNNEANASGHNLSFSLRSLWERYHILRHYIRNINTIEKLIRIFPEVENQHSKGLVKELIPYYIAKLFLNDFEKRTNAHLFLGINSLYQVLKSEQELLEGRHHFNNRNFINITSKFDLFNIKIIQNQSKAIRKRDDAIASKNAAIRKRDDAIASKNAAIRKRDAAITAKNDAIRKRDAAITAKNDAIRKRDAAIKSKNELIQIQNEAITAKNNAIRKRDEVITTKNEAIRKRDAAIKSKDKLITQKEKLIKEQLAQISLRDKELNSIYSSRLWKLMSIIRKIVYKTKFYYILKTPSILKKEGLKGLQRRVLNKLNIKRKYDIIIKIPVPNGQEKGWGDYHFALSLQKALRKRSYKTHIHCLSDWYNTNDLCDTVIVLRGLTPYQPRKEHLNIMWNISHPDKVTVNEYNKYDYVFIASVRWALEMSSVVTAPVEALLQCTNIDVFKPKHCKRCKTELLFVGNSRRIRRDIIDNLLPTDYALSVYGSLWDGIIDNKYIKASYIPNHKLNRYYSSCDILLNDHWDDMRKKGFISNRLFDGFACGAFIISDKVYGGEDIFKDAFVCYESKDELNALIDKYIHKPELREVKAKIGMEIVRSEHTFKNRADKIINIIETFKNKY